VEHIDLEQLLCQRAKLFELHRKISNFVCIILANLGNHQLLVVECRIVTST